MLTYPAPIDLGDAVPEGINNAGVVVGSVGAIAASSVGGIDDLRAVWWPAGATEPVRVDVASGELTRGYGINDRGQLLIGAGHPECPKDVYVVDPLSGASTRWAAADECSQPWGFNASAEVLINRTSASGRSDSIVWISETGEVDSPPSGVGSGVILNDINSSGQVVGTTDGAPFLWDRSTGAVHYLDVAGATAGWASDLNDRGEIVGRLPTADSTVVWSDSAAVPRPIGDSDMYPSDINELGQILLTSNTGAGAWVWEPRTDTFSVLPDAQQAFAINDLGQVVGIAGPPNVSFAALWNPID